jgi:cell division protein FtsQ
VEKERKRKRKKRSKWRIFVIIVLLLISFAAIAVKVFKVEEVTISGNRHYDNSIIEDWVLNDKYSWNTLYVYLKYQFRQPEEIPFVDSMEVTMKDPYTIGIKVIEKALLGYVYLSSLGQNAYFDKDGFVVEISSEEIEGIPKITGVNMEQVVLYEKLPIKNEVLLRNLLNITQTLKKYEVIPQGIVYREDKTFLLSYGKVEVLLGLGERLNEKIVRLSYIMPDLAKKKGVLHLENWTENTTDIVFEN